jgi:hypothetical protein
VDQPEFTPFYGQYASTGTSSDTTYDYSGEDYSTAPSESQDDTGGEDYDPRYYESPPQDAPEAPAPAPAPNDTGGVAPGNGRGNGGDD